MCYIIHSETSSTSTSVHFYQHHLCALTIHNQVPVQHVAVPLWQLDGDGNYFVEERTSIIHRTDVCSSWCPYKSQIQSDHENPNIVNTNVLATCQEHVSCGS